MLCRRGVSLIEVLIAVAILALLIGLVLGAIQKVRAEALRAESLNNLRQIISGVHQLADQDEGRIKGLTQSELPRKPLYTEQTIFYAILPWTCPERPKFSPGMTLEQINEFATPRVKVYRSRADPSYVPLPWYVESGDERRDKCSYVANMLAFDGVHRFPVSVPDGTASTVAFSEHYFNCGGPPEGTGPIFYEWLFPATNTPGGTRRATFADRGWHDVMPVTDAATGRTVASMRGRTFQYRPKPEEADNRLPQTPHPGGLPVALFDGSVRTLSPSIDESVFWSLVTPNGGEVIGDF